MTKIEAEAGTYAERDLREKYTETERDRKQSIEK